MNRYIKLLKKTMIVSCLWLYADILNAQEAAQVLNLELLNEPASFEHEMLFSDTAVPMSNRNCTSGNCPQDYFSQLEALYSNGTVPSATALVGWFSGRCYWSNVKITPTNVVLLGWNDGGNNGPLFPGKEVFKALWAIYLGKSADYYDNLSISIEDELNKFLDSNKNYAFESSVENGALMTGIGNGKWYVRQSGSYVVMQIFEFDRVQAYCYTFKKIK